jgi:phage baseplate assembly protein W
MALTQRYGIRYPFALENNEELYMDLNLTQEDSLKSRLLHVIFTPKGQRLRNPDFGTDLIKYIHEPSDETTFDRLKNDITQQVYKYVPDVSFKDISIYDDENNENGKIVIIHYTIKKGSKEIEQTAALRV